MTSGATPDKTAAPISPSTASPAAVTQYQATGVIEQVTAEDITLSHQPVPALQWPAMTMAYKKPAAASTAAEVARFKTGDKVNFSFQQDGDGWQLTGMTAANGGQP